MGYIGIAGGLLMARWCVCRLAWLMSSVRNMASPPAVCWDTVQVRSPAAMAMAALPGSRQCWWHTTVVACALSTTSAVASWLLLDWVLMRLRLAWPSMARAAVLWAVTTALTASRSQVMPCWVPSLTFMLCMETSVHLSQRSRPVSLSHFMSSLSCRVYRQVFCLPVMSDCQYEHYWSSFSKLLRGGIIQAPRRTLSHCWSSSRQRESSCVSWTLAAWHFTPLSCSLTLESSRRVSVLSGHPSA